MNPLRWLGNIVFWSYRRGSWQYDILCAFILLFIFVTPPAIFDGSYFTLNKPEDKIEDSEKPTDKILQGGVSLGALPELGALGRFAL